MSIAETAPSAVPDSGTTSLSGAIPPASEPTQQGAAEGEKQSGGDDTPATGAPAEYEPFTLPEGWEVTDEDLSAFGEVAREMGLSQERGQQLVDFFVRIEGQRAEQLPALVDQMTKEKAETEKVRWVEELQQDPELQTKRTHIKALEDAGLVEPSFAKLLIESGWLNRKEVVNQLAKLGALLQEESPATGDAGSTPPVDRAQRLFEKSGHVA